ncbi:hypothetical protein EC973_004328 [Apophysomyces ossiformis]|uniref:DnaJ homolog 1, mitochondrial n=1 Tax=Apophysomyces ossiformis TaxID=679940 RepID=A0A8H7EKL6_9FUNG|nr:hypothetical protein EC973_004328 [Apophysomyces ossiformis]
MHWPSFRQVLSCRDNAKSIVIITTKRPLTDTARGYSKRDPYQILGVEPSASKEEIKKVYYALAKQYHPDTSKDRQAQEKFAQIKEAYETLCDEKKWSSHRPLDEPWQTETRRRAPPGFSTSDLFGTRADQFRPATGEDIQVQLTVSFLENIHGITKPVVTERITYCGACHGSGLRAGKQHNRTVCGSCHGTGKQPVSLGGLPMSSACETCGGTGSILTDDSFCVTCRGMGRVREHHTVLVDVPPGTDNQARIRVPGQGHAPWKGNGRPGDLFVRLNVEPSSIFQRQDADLFIDVKIPFYKAILGGTVRVPTVYGETSVGVPADSQPGDRIILQGYGIHRPSKPQGDQIIALQIEYPRTMTEQQKAIIEQYAYLVDSDEKSPTNC